MNCELFELRELEVEQYQIREVLRCILHTIMFNRALGLVRPKDVDSDLFDVTYAQCNDPSIAAAIEEKISQFGQWVEKQPTKKAQICLSFYEKRHRPSAMSWFASRSNERWVWEQWVVPIAIIETTPVASHQAEAAERARRTSQLEADLRDVMMQIIMIVNEKKDHIPPVLTSDVASFPYEISIPSLSDSAFGMEVLKRMLQTSPPNMLG